MSLLERFYLQFAQEALMVVLYIVGLIVCVRNHRMSRWMPIVVAGFAAMIVAPPLVQAVGIVVRPFKDGEEFVHFMRIVEILQSLVKVVGMGLVVTGFGLVLIDLGRGVSGHLRESKEVNQPAPSGTEVGMS